jgi:mycobactin salicyl-AMP ligase
MILTDHKDAERYMESGIWGERTLDFLLQRTALTRPGTVALFDSGAEEDGERAALRELNWAELETRVARLARMFFESGLRQDEVIGIQLPNSVEAVIAILAALRAGLIPAVFPLVWRRRDLAAAGMQLAPCALVTTGRIGGVPHAEIMRDVAAETISVRHVFAFGSAPPDGVVTLDEALADDAAREGDHISSRMGNPADHLAMLTFDMTSAACRPVARSHNQWLSAATAVTQAAGLRQDSVLATSMAPTSLAGLASGLVAWLICGCRLVLLRPDELDSKIGDAVARVATHLVLPGPVALRRNTGAPDRAPAPIRIWRSEPDSSALDGAEATDILSLREMALSAGTRRFVIPLTHGHDAVSRGQLLLARMDGLVHRAGNASAPGALLRGALSVGGPQLPSPHFPGTTGKEGVDGPDADGFWPTGLRCVLAETQPAAVRVIGQVGDVFTRGGIHIPADEVDRLYAGFPGARDAAAIGVPDPVMGMRLHAAIAPVSDDICSLEALRVYLTEMGAAPYLLPEEIVPVEKVPRALDGSVLRSLLDKVRAA